MIDIDKEYLLLAGENNDPEITYVTEGEGPLIGTPSVFFRMFGCNLTCRAFSSPDSPWGCDSYVSWSKKNKMTFREVFELVESNKWDHQLHKGAIMKLTGGEPMLRQAPLMKFIEAWEEKYGWMPTIDFETNATIMPDKQWYDWDATFTTSPKLSSNGDSREKTYVLDVLDYHASIRSAFKFVIQDERDVEEVFRDYIDGGPRVDLSRVWFMPCCGSRQEHIERAPAVAELARQCCVNFSPRLHLLLYDKALRV